MPAAGPRRSAAEAGEASKDDIDLYCRSANSLRRLLESVGLQRRAKHVTLLDAWDQAQVLAAAERETAADTSTP